MWPFKRRRPPTDWPQIGRTHKDGARFVGVDLGQVQPFWDRGTPVVNQLLQASVELELVSTVRIGDRLDVRFDGERHWWALRDSQRLGRLTWSLSTFDPKPWIDRSPARFDIGELEVTRLLLDTADVVINFGGIVRPS